MLSGLVGWSVFPLCRRGNAFVWPVVLTAHPESITRAEFHEGQIMFPSSVIARNARRLLQWTLVLAAILAFPAVCSAQHHGHHSHGHHGHHGGGISGGHHHHHHSSGFYSGGYYGGSGLYGGLYGPSIGLSFRSSAYPGSYYSGSNYYSGSGYYGRPYSGIQSYSVRSYTLVPSQVYVAPQYSPPPVFRSSPQYPLGGISQQGSVTPSPLPSTSPVPPSTLSSNSSQTNQVVGDPINGELRPGMVLPDGSVVVSVQPLSGEIVPQGTPLPPTAP